MKNAENEKTRKRPTLIDVFVIIGALLLIVAVIGQDVAVYMINRGDRSERFDIAFSIPSIGKESADALKNARIAAGEMTVLYDGEQLGTVYGGFEDGQAQGEYAALRGTLRAEGKTVDGDCRIYGFNRVFRTGDRLYIVFEDAEGNYSLGCTVEIASITKIDGQ